MEPISYESARRTAPLPDPDPLLRKGPLPVPFDPAAVVDRNQADTIAVAKRRALSRRELAASQGAYTGGDLVWLLPQAVLPSWLVPKPGDVVVPAEGDRYVVLDLTLGKGRQTWRLTCRNLTLAFDLRDRIDVERPQISYDDPSGAIRKHFPTGPGPRGGETLYAQLACKVHLDRKEIAEERGIRGSKEVGSIVVERELAVTSEDRVRLADGTYLEIRGYHNSQQLDELPVIDVERAV